MGNDDHGAPAAPHSTFDRELAEVEDAVVAMGRGAVGLLRFAGQVAGGATPADAAEAHRADDEIDRAFLNIEWLVIQLIARRQPVAGDLRRILAMNQTSLHLERIADGSVDVVAFVEAEGSAPDAAVAGALAQMAATVVEMTATAVRSLTDRDTEGALAVEALDDELNALLAEIGTRIGSLGADAGQVLLVDRCARALSRAGGHAVDIAEVAWFAATGELRELNRAPEVLRPR